MKHLLCMSILAFASCDPTGGQVREPEGPSVVEVPAPEIALCLGSHSLEDDAIAELQDLGIVYVRHTLYPNLWEEDPAYRAHFPKRVTAGTAAGLRLILVVHPLPDGWSALDFAHWIGDRARQMPDVWAWQIGNEVYLGHDVDAHIEAHWNSYLAIKAADPDARVVTMALPTIEAARAFAESGAPADALSVHAYGFPLADRVWELRRWLPTDAVAWMTEFGIEEKVIPDAHEVIAGGWENVQLQEWQAAIAAAEGAGYALACGYQLRTEEPAETHGLVRPDGSYRPAAEWLRSALADPS